MSIKNQLGIEEEDVTIIPESTPRSCCLPTSPFSPTDNICETPKVILLCIINSRTNMYRQSEALLLRLLLPNFLHIVILMQV